LRRREGEGGNRCGHGIAPCLAGGEKATRICHSRVENAHFPHILCISGATSQSLDHQHKFQDIFSQQPITPHEPQRQPLNISAGSILPDFALI
jgi:hypothetical protein